MGAGYYLTCLEAALLHLVSATPESMGVPDTILLPDEEEPADPGISPSSSSSIFATTEAQSRWQSGKEKAQKPSSPYNLLARALPAADGVTTATAAVRGRAQSLGGNLLKGFSDISPRNLGRSRTRSTDGWEGQGQGLPRKGSREEHEEREGAQNVSKGTERGGQSEAGGTRVDRSNSTSDLTPSQLTKKW